MAVSRTSSSVTVTAFFAALYLYGCTQGVQASDSAELMMVAGGGGRLHPPGYPALQAWLSLWQLFPFGTIAWKASAACAMLGAMALGIVHNALHRWTESSGLAFFAVLMLGLQPLWIRYCTMSEAFSSAALVYAMLVWCAICVREKASRRVGIGLGSAVALGVASHHVFIAAFPLILWTLWKLGKHRYWSIGIGVCGVFAYVPLVTVEGVWVWGQIEDVPSLINFILRRDYGTFQITHSDVEGSWWGNPWLYARYWALDSWFIFPLLTLLSLFRSKGALYWSIAASWLVASVGLLALFQLPASGEYGMHTQRFFMAPTLLSLPLVVKGGEWIWRHRTARGLFVFPALLMLQFPHIASRNDHRMSDFVRNACRILPNDSMALVDGDGAIFAFHYVQRMLGMCPSVEIIAPSLLVYSWYLPDVEERSTAALIERHLGERVVVASLGLVGNEQQQLPPAVPFGGVWMRFVPPQEPFPSPPQIEQHLVSVMSSFDTHPSSSHDFLYQRAPESWVSSQYAHSWLALASAYERFQSPEKAAYCRSIAESLRGGDWFATEEE